MGFEAIQCPNCSSTKMEVGSTVKITSAEHDNLSTWTFEGSYQLVRCMHGRCCNCGMVVDTITQEIPIQFTSVRCPKCDSAEHMKGKAPHFKLKDQAYEFRTSFSCSSCNKKYKMRKTLKNVWSLVSFKVSPKGVEIEVDGGN